MKRLLPQLNRSKFKPSLKPEADIGFPESTSVKKYKSALIIVIFTSLITGVFFSAQKLRHQLQWQVSFLEDELVIEMYEFSQLQRETLRLSQFLTSSGTTEDANLNTLNLETLQLHTDLVQSRITIIQKSKTHQTHGSEIDRSEIDRSEREVTENIRSIVQDWLTIKQQINNLQQTPNDTALRQSILSQLETLEFQINRFNLSNNQEHWVEYKSIFQSQNEALSFLIFLIISFFLSATLFSFYALRFAKTRQQLLEKMKRDSITDDLTQIANRRYFNQIIAKEWNRALRSQTQIALMLCDIDYFKRYNDYYGHQAGDECLHTIAQALNQSTHRAGDFIARYGGEEFVIILPATSVQAALKFAALVHTRVAQENITHKTSAVSSCVTLSIGIAVGVPTPNLRAETALRFADEALYEAKNSGRNQSCQHMFNLTKLKQWPQQVIKAQ